MEYYKIAELSVAMETYGKTLKRAEVYRNPCNSSSDIIIESIKDTIQSRYPAVTDEDAEYLGTGYSFYLQLLAFDGLMLHASAVVMDDKAYLISADSGVGKSTHTGLWLKRYSQAYILNDDKPALRIIGGKWYAYGTPWSGKHDLNANKKVPLAAICMIERADNNEIRRLSPKESFKKIYMQTNRPKSTDGRIKLMELLDDLLQNIPIWNLKCNMNLEAAELAYDVMSNVDDV